MSGDGLSGDDTVNPLDFLGDLTYDEVHSFVLGLGAVVIAALTGQWALLGSLSAAAYALRPVSSKVERVVMREPWYFAAGAATAAPLALLAMVVRAAVGV
jgi:hypothetical protein